jgi:hypothetical protein
MRDLWEVRAYELFRIASSYERHVRTWRKVFVSYLLQEFYFEKNHENPPMEAKNKAWYELRTSTERYELWGKSRFGKNSKCPCLCNHCFMFIILKIKDWLTCEGRISGARFQHLGQKFFYEDLLEADQDLTAREMLTVYFVHQKCSLHFGLDLIMKLTRH